MIHSSSCRLQRPIPSRKMQPFSHASPADRPIENQLFGSTGLETAPLYHSMSALLDASSLLPLRATSPIKAALITMRQRMIAPTMTSGFFIQRQIMPKVLPAAKLAHSIFLSSR